MPRTHSRDLVGKRFGRLTVECETDNRSTAGHIIWKCRCSCGNKKPVFVMTHNLTSVTKNTQSCGCWQKEQSPGCPKGGRK